MKRLIWLLLLTMAHGQLSIQQNNAPKDAKGCTVADPKTTGLCVWPDGQVKVSFNAPPSNGTAYVDPPNTGAAGAPTVVVGTTTTLPPGSNAAVTDGDPGPNVILNFSLVTGPKGDKGDKGDPGTNFSGGVCKFKVTGPTDANGFVPIQITCP